jgi:hypothetical protein
MPLIPQVPETEIRGITRYQNEHYVMHRTLGSHSDDRAQTTDRTRVIATSEGSGDYVNAKAEILMAKPIASRIDSNITGLQQLRSMTNITTRYHYRRLGAV